MTVIQFVSSARGTVPKGLEVRDSIKTIQTTAVLRSVRILSRVLET